MSFEETTTESHERRIQRCRSCNAQIIWFKTAAGKNMPVDADTVEPDDDVHEIDLRRHKSHFATCPNAEILDQETLTWIAVTDQLPDDGTTVLICAPGADEPVSLGGAEVMPLAIDLFCGLGGWTEGLLAEGYYVVGFDNVRHVYGEHKYPAQLVIQDVLTLDGKQFKDAALIVGSSPCQEFSYRAMPWKRAKALPPPELGMKLFNAQFRIQREASGAAGHHIPLVVENVRGAIPWVGRSRWNYGSFHLWGDVPALMPMTQKRGQKFAGFRFDGSGRSFQTAAVDGVKVPGMNWSGSDKPGYKAQAFNDNAVKLQSLDGGRRTDVGKGARFTSRDCGDDIKCGGDWSGPGEDSSAMRNQSSRSPKRKMASAMIAKIPLPLARHIARVWKPVMKAKA